MEQARVAPRSELVGKLLKVVELLQAHDVGVCRLYLLQNQGKTTWPRENVLRCLTRRQNGGGSDELAET